MVNDSIYLNIGSNAQTADAARRVAFGHFILRKIIATRCQILRLKCTNIDFGWDSAPGPAGGAYSALSDAQTPSWNKGKRMDARKGRGGQRGEGRGRDRGERREGAL